MTTDVVINFLVCIYNINILYKIQTHSISYYIGNTYKKKNNYRNQFHHDRCK